MNGSVVGEVVMPGGRPVANASVLIASASSAHADIAAVTDRRGRFSFLDLPVGRYEFLVNAPGHPLERASVEIEPGRQIELRVTVRAGTSE